MKYLFSTDNTNLIITLDTESGKYNPEITTVNDPNITLENDRIWFYENGKYIRNFPFYNIGTISGVTPTSIADAFEKLNVVIDELYLLVSPKFKGSIVPTDLATGTEDAVWIATQAGTYANFGGVVVSANSRAEISRVNGVFSISQTAFVIPPAINKIIPWTATSFALGDQVNYLGKDWVSNADTLAGDVPGTSSKWVERLSGYLDMNKAITNEVISEIPLNYRIIDEGLFITDISPNVVWTDSSLYFTQTTKISNLFMPNTSSGVVKIYKGVVTPHPIVVGSSPRPENPILILNVNVGVFEYVVDFTVNAGEYLMFEATDGALKFRYGGINNIKRFSGVSPFNADMSLDNAELGIGFNSQGDLVTANRITLTNFIKTGYAPFIDTNVVTVDTLNTPNVGLEKIIVGADFTEDVATSTVWTDTTLHFTSKVIVTKLFIPSTANGNLKVFAGVIVPYPVEINVSTRPIDHILTIPIVAGKSYYDVYITVEQGCNLLFSSDTLGAFKFHFTGEAITTYKFNAGSPYKSSEVLNGCELGIGYKTNSGVILKALSDFVKSEANVGVDYFKGKKLNVIGDSMVFGDGLGTANAWPALIGSRLGMTVINYGQNGNVLSNSGRPTPVVLRYTEMDNDADFVLTFIGTNDAGLAVEMGTDNSTDITTFKGALNVYCDGLITKYPNKKLGFITPYLRDASYQAYIDAIKLICKKYSIPVFDNAENGGVCWTNSAQVASITMSDTYHLNLQGMIYASYKYESFLKSL